MQGGDDLSEFFRAGLMDDRDDEPCFQGHRNADIDVVRNQNMVAVEESVQKRMSTQNRRYSLDQKSRQGQVASGLFLGLPGQDFPVALGFRHVDFDGCCKMGSRLKTLLHALADCAAQPRECDPLARNCGIRFSGSLLEMPFDILQAGHTTRAAAFDFRKIEIVFPG